MKLLIGSWGTLAVITGASFKLFPYPRNCRTFVACFGNISEATAYRDRVLRSPLDPMCLELLSPEASALLTPGAPPAAFWSVCVRGRGSDAVLARYRSELGSVVVHEMEGDKEAAFWRIVADFLLLAGGHHPNSLLLSFSVPLRHVLPVLNDAASVADGNGLKLAAIGRIGVGHILVALWPAGAAADSAYVSAVSALRERLPHDASMAVLHCSPGVQKEVGALRTPTHVESMRAVKRALDPKDVLNRGRFVL
jgi:FAD/FMN-containing dehydrogenase